jgi:broad specificity phosphatase PhoE
MPSLSRIILVRHGETEGRSSIRFHGRTDVSLSCEGQEQMRAAARSLPISRFELVVASPLSRAWAAAAILAPGSPVRLEADFREIDFGRWEGLTSQEIETLDPMLARNWLEAVEGFEFPEGEPRQEFRSRVLSGLDRLLVSEVCSALVVTHKGVIRTIVEQLCGEKIEATQPALGGVIKVDRGAEGSWRRTR